MSVYRYVSLFATVLTSIAIIITPPLLFVLINKIKDRTKQFQIQFKYGGLFDEFKEEGIMVYSVLMFYIRRMIALVGLVFFSSYVNVQSYLFASSTLMNLIWNLSLFPYKKPIDNILNILSDLLLLVSHILYSFMIDESITMKQLTLYGDIIYYILQGSTWVLLIGMVFTLINCIKTLIRYCKNLRKKKAPVIQVHGNNLKVQNFINEDSNTSMNETKTSLKIEITTYNRYTKRKRNFIKDGGVDTKTNNKL